MKKKVFVKTYGCQMNVYDSVRMLDVLKPLGYESVERPDEADMVILNTCHIREKAAEKVYSELGRLRDMKTDKKKQGKEVLLAVAGCVAQAEGDEMFRRAPYLDMVFGPQAFQHLPEMIAKVERAGPRQTPKGHGILNVDFPAEPKFDALPEETSSQGGAAFIAVQEGCDKFCTFCVVPYTRGAEYSRPAQDIVKEAKKLIAGGAHEISLLGQNVNAYHGIGANGQEASFADLLYQLAELDGLKRLRYTTSHPREMTDDLIEAHGKIDVLMPYLHLPIQSGSDRILQLMNRQYTADDYRRIVDRFRAVKPNLALSSDFIIGFPGESDKDFEATMQLVRDVGYAQAYSFKYSPRPGTPASVMDLQVPEDVKSARLTALQALLSEQQFAFNRKSVGQTMPVLFERTTGKGQLWGRSPYMQTVHVKGDARLIGHIIDVTIDHASPNSLTGQVITGEYKSIAVETRI